MVLRLQGVQRIRQRHELQDTVHEDPVRSLLPGGKRHLPFRPGRSLGWHHQHPGQSLCPISHLVRSYALEGLLESKQQIPPPHSILAQALKFLEEITVAEEHQFPSISHGTDHRFKGNDLAGAALVHESEVVHAAFFRLDGIEQPERMASTRLAARTLKPLIPIPLKAVLGFEKDAMYSAP
jgi:hypothetical protein